MVALVAVAAGAGCGNELPIYTPDCVDDGCESGTCYRYASTASSNESFCTAECVTDAECPYGGYCFEIDGDPNMTRACFQACQVDIDCDADWVCTEAIDADTGASRGFICLPP